ncbi:hypothetical protein C8J56DRAFT_1058897 [Mycena floridula]|nr:hypothetical protein C8J56DRAFT_1058897 [Mycena floridula]
MTASDKQLQPVNLPCCAGSFERIVYVVTPDEDGNSSSWYLVRAWTAIVQPAMLPPDFPVLHQNHTDAQGEPGRGMVFSGECQNWWLTTFQTDHEDVVNSLLGDKVRETRLKVKPQRFRRI